MRPESGRGRARTRILVVNWQDRRNPRAGGAEIHLHEIFGRLARRGHRVVLLASGWSGGEEREAVDGIEVHRAGTRHTFPLRVRDAYRRRLADREFDLVVEDINKVPLYTPLWVDAPVVGLVPHLFGTTAFRQASVPVAAVVWIAERLMPVVYRDVPFQVISPSTKGDLVRRGFREDRIEVVPPGVDHDRYRPSPDGARHPDPTFVYVGRLVRYKGLEVVVRALGLLARRGVEARLELAGVGDDSARLGRIVEREGLGDRVEFLGYVSEERKVELFRRAWAAIYPSPKEGWGLSAVEAAACGTPTVASDSPGLRDSVADGVSGLLVRNGDAGGWAEALARICREESLRERLSEGAVEHAGRFSWDRAAEETESLLAGYLRSLRPA